MYKIIIENRKVFKLKDVIKADNNKKNEIIVAKVLDNLRDAMALNFFFGWA